MKKKIILVCSFIGFCIPFLSLAQKKKNKQEEPPAAFILKNSTDSLSYALGVSISKNLLSQGFDSLIIDAINAGIMDYTTKKPLKISPEESNTLLNNYFAAVQGKKGEAKKNACQKFLDENKSKPGVKTTASGLQYLVLKEGEGPMPLETDKVKTHYHGTLIDGTVFDSSVQRGEPVSFPVNGVIKGWTEALQMMKVGSKWKLFIPSDLAYGTQGAGGVIEANEALIFEVELIAIEK